MCAITLRGFYLYFVGGHAVARPSTCFLKGRMGILLYRTPSPREVPEWNQCPAMFTRCRSERFFWGHGPPDGWLFFFHIRRSWHPCFWGRAFIGEEVV